MKRKKLRILFGCACFAGFLWAFGALGSIDRGIMDLGSGVLNIAIGVAVCGVSWLALEMTD